MRDRVPSEGEEWRRRSECGGISKSELMRDWERFKDYIYIYSIRSSYRILYDNVVLGLYYGFIEKKVSQSNSLQRYVKTM